MTTMIEHVPNKHIPMFGGIDIDIYKSVFKKLGSEQELTKDVGLKILNNIKWQTKLKSLATKPVVVIPMTLGLAVTALVIPSVAAVSTLVLTVAALIYSVACALFVYMFGHALDGNLGNLSNAYSKESEQAKFYIGTLTDGKEIKLASE